MPLHEKLKCKLLMPKKLKTQIANAISDTDRWADRVNTICPFPHFSNGVGLGERGRGEVGYFNIKVPSP